jgi:hypothetical protein
MNTLHVRRSRYGYWVIIGFLAAPGLSVAVCFQTNPSAQQQCLANEEREREQEEQARERQRAQEEAQERYQEQQRAQQETQQRYQEQQQAQQEAQQRYQGQQQAQQEAQQRYQGQQQAQQEAQQRYQEQQQAQQEAQQRYQEQQQQAQQRAQQEAQQRYQEQQQQAQQRAQQEAQQRSQEQQQQAQQRAQQEAQQRSQEQQRVQLEAQQRSQEQQRLIEEQAKNRIQPQYRTPEPAPQAASSGYPSSPAQTAPHSYRPGAENPGQTPVSGEGASPEGVKRSDGSVVYTPRPHGPLPDGNARVPVPVVPEAVRPHDSPMSDAPPPPLVGIPRTGGFSVPGVAGPNGAVVYRPRNAHEVPVAAEVTDVAPPVITRVSIVQPVTTGFTNVPAPVANQPLAIAVAQMQSAQAGCAQADAYQNYVNTVVSAQNTTDQGIAQTLQTLAANTADPGLQNALLSSIGQPDPINDALQQQMQGMAGTYETVCQTRMANAQSALAQSLGQSTPATPGQGANGSSVAAPGVQPGAQAGAAANPTSTAASTSNLTAQTGTQSSAAGDTPCAATAASNLPSPQAPWGGWSPIGNTGLVFDVSRVNDTTSTWRFMNAGANTISSMQFNYSYVDANSGQQATQQDVLPYALAPRQSVGGWAAYTANTRGEIVISVTQISCH